jgi:type VI secretion system protein ImpA
VTPPAEGEEASPSGPDLASVEAQIRAADPDELSANHAVVQEALAAAQGIDEFLGATLGAGSSINFEELTGTLEQLEKTIANYLPGAGGEAGGGGEEGGVEEGGGGGMAAGPAISGSIRSRDDVVRMLDKICDYYRQVEPGSPVPYILRRAQKLALMNFLDAMAELNIAGPEQLKPIMGSIVDGGTEG